MKWAIEFSKDARKDFNELDNSQRRQVSKAIDKVSTNPYPNYEGGYGKPLGNKNGNNLTGLLKIKLRQLGIRVVYKLVRERDAMRIIVISIRDDNKVYEIAVDRMDK